MATFREVINRVLIAVGQSDDQVDSGATELTDKYHITVAQWVNDFLEEIEDAAQWRVLRQRISATVSADGVSATLTGANERSRVFRVSNEHAQELVPLVFDVTDTDSQKPLKEMDFAELLWRDQSNSNESAGTGPRYFALNATSSGMEIYVYPRSTTDIDLEIDMIIPQSRLDQDDDLGTSIKIPTRCLVQGVTWWAQEDRGEEFGVDAQTSKQRYERMLADLVAAENAAQGFDELVPV